MCEHSIIFQYWQQFLVNVNINLYMKDNLLKIFFFYAFSKSVLTISVICDPKRDIRIILNKGSIPKIGAALMKIKDYIKEVRVNMDFICLSGYILCI